MRHEETKAAHQFLGKEATLYDEMIICSTLPGKLICGLVWEMNKPRNDHYLDLALSGIPEDPSDRMLEVPMGTDTPTMPVYRTLPKANTTCLDYFTATMETVQRRATAVGPSSVHLTQGDVEGLPFSDNTFGLVLSLNGFHAPLSKEAAYRETSRMLKPDGIFCGYFYTQGEQSRTDWFIEKLCVLKDFFTPPFETAADLGNRMKQRYTEVTMTVVDSMGCSCCVKGSEDAITHKS